ncbi:hypothetical protein R1sor_020127 [Riccia sorocarpa]|uniref:Amino acid transporter n=1 Tax=Riccia sorocarpa TaxID=122646 RepID=A0ABD3IEE6_9MARC
MNSELDSEKELLIMGLEKITHTDQSRLEALGYKQELKRDLSLVANFAFSFSIISILTGVTTLYGTGLTYGGTISMVYGWIIAGCLNMFVALSMAEICSAYPTSAGLYYWSYTLAGPSWGPFAAWITGWFNVIGQWAMTTSVDYSLATLMRVIILLSTGGGNGGGYYANKYVVVLFHGGLLFVHALINSLSIAWVSYLGTFAAVWNVFGVFTLMFLIPLVATHKQTAESVFTSFRRDPSTGIHSEPYIFLLGLLMSQYTMTGYDASAHMSEETKSSDKNGGYGILSALGISIVVGWGYVVGLSFAVVNPDRLLDPNNDAKGYAIAQVFYDVFNDRFGSGTGGILCLGVVAGAVFFCGMSCITSNSRMAFAFSRDGALPLSKVWRVVRNDVPVRTVWLSAAVAFAMALTSLGSLVAFQAMVSITTIGLYIAYALPIFFKLTLGRKTFAPGHINLGPFSTFINWVAVLWVLTLVVLFSLPTIYPIEANTLNYTPIAVGILLLYALGYWFLSARHWFKGPVGSLESKEAEA